MVESLFESLLSLYGYIIIGAILGYVLKSHREKSNKVCTNILIYIVSPLQIFITLITTTFELNFALVMQIILLATGAFFFLLISSYAILKKKQVEPKKMGSYLLLNAMPNVMFYSIPIVISVFSDDLTIIVVLFASTNLVLRGSVASYFCQRLGADIKPNWKQTIVNLFKFPPFDAILLGSILVATKAAIPLDVFIFIKSPVNTLASGVGAVVIGMILSSLTWPDVKKYRVDIQLVSLWRFLFALGFYMIFAYLLVFDQQQTEIRTILLIISMGPPAVFNVVFAVYFHLEEKFAAITVATLTLVALIFLPLLIYVGMLIF